MKLFDVIREDDRQVTEEILINRMRSFDWNYELRGDISKIAAGNSELSIIEGMTYKLWKIDPESAVRVWNENCPYAPQDKSTLPSFILRRQFMEGAQSK